MPGQGAKTPEAGMKEGGRRDRRQRCQDYDEDPTGGPWTELEHRGLDSRCVFTMGLDASRSPLGPTFRLP
eukprot:scaffold8554_cov248-Pinguiococcus_pyrenoidosus.AAC.1